MKEHERMMLAAVGLALATGAGAATQPYVDISGETWRHSVVAAGTTNVMQGHANTVLLDDGKTMFCVWPNHHGGYWGNLARSEDGGRSWTRCDELLPAGTTNNIECPVIYNLKDPAGKSRIWCWTGFRIKEWEYTAATWVGHPKRLAAAEIGDPMPAVMSEDGGKTWKAMPPKGPEFRCVLSFNGIVRLKDGSYLGVYHRSINGKGCIDKSPLEICSSVTRDGGFTWEAPRVIANDPKLDMCEPWVFRSPDGEELCCLIREHRSGRAQIMFSRDEGQTWTKPKKAPAGLSGHRHQGVVLPDGRVVVCFRDTEPGFPCHYVAWIGPYAALHNREQDKAYRVKLLHSWAGWDCGYSGVNLLPDGTVVCTTYVKYENNDLKQSVVTTRFKPSETDALVAAAPKYVISDFDVDVDIDAAPVKDLSKCNSRAFLGYNCHRVTNYGGMDYYFFDQAKDDTAAAMKDAGAWIQRVQWATTWFGDRSADNPETGHKKTDPAAAFRFWKDNGIKVLLNIEAATGRRDDDAKWRKSIEDFRKTNLELVRFIVDNGFQDVVVGFELGNETYFMKHYAELAEPWAAFIDEARKIWPKIHFGINVAELFELNPDIEHVRGRMLSSQALKRNEYFAADAFNQYSAQFILKMKEIGALDKVDHIVWHAYGGETPYSCSFHGMKRFRDFVTAFPELKGKKWWLTEVRNRSDEDPSQCQRMFNDTLVMGHYTLMALAMPEVECLNHHQIWGMSGGIYTSEAESRGGKGQFRWGLQRQDGGRDYPDYRAIGRPRFETGHMGVMHRMVAEAMMGHPVVLAHGTGDYDTGDDAMTASARVSDQMYARRRAMREAGRDAWLEPKPIEGVVEWTAAVDERRQELVVLFVNSSDTERLARVKTPKHEFGAPTLRVMECPAWAVDNAEVPGEGRVWRQYGYEDSNTGWTKIRMAPFDKLRPYSMSSVLKVPAHSVVTATVRIHRTRK